jgi:post-segregation antitoxin (ccd killing protein)
MQEISPIRSTNTINRVNQFTDENGLIEAKRLYDLNKG